MTPVFVQLSVGDRRDCLHWDVKWVSLYKSTQKWTPSFAHHRGKESNFKETKQRTIRMVATPDCGEKSKPIAGHKVCGPRPQQEIKFKAEIWIPLKSAEEILTWPFAFVTGIQTSHGEETTSSHQQVFGPVKISSGELLQHQCTYGRKKPVE